MKMYPMERMVNQTLWFAVMPEKFNGEECAFENETFMIKPYDWTNEENNGYHFHHKPSGLKIQWYKYPMRSCCANMKFTHEQFLAVLYDCYNSLNMGFTHDIDKWWGSGNINVKSDEHLDAVDFLKEKLYDIKRAIYPSDMETTIWVQNLIDSYSTVINDLENRYGQTRDNKNIG